MPYLEFNDSQYTELQKSLLKHENSDIQKEFLQAARKSESFLDYMSQISVENKSTDQPFDLLSDSFTGSQFERLHMDDEKKIYDKWKKLTSAQTSHSTFWGYVTLEHIRQGIIQSGHLATSNGIEGIERIDKALKENKGIDTIVRTILRRLSGVYERGVRSVYSDCVYARAWWRGHIANQVCQDSNAERDKVIKVFSSSQNYWEELTSLIVSRNAILGDTKVRSALIWALSELVDDARYKKLFTVKQIRIMSRWIGVRSAYQELAVLSVEELRDMMREFISI